MRILGIDYGRKRIGIAMSEGPLAEPLKVIKIRYESEAIEKLVKIVEVEKVEKVVVGVSEGKMAEESRKFGKKLEEDINISVVFQDETLTTKEAQDLSQKAGIKRKKRRELEDAYSASLILQSYIDNN